MSILQRVVDLLRLAADAGAAENEARNAAVQAAKLIAQHGLRVIDSRSSTATATHTTTQTTTRTTSSVWRPSHPHYEEFMARERARQAKYDHWERAAQQAQVRAIAPARVTLA